MKLFVTVCSVLLLSQLRPDPPKTCDACDAWNRPLAGFKVLATIERLPCDIILSVHLNFTDLDRKLARLTAQPGVNPFIDPKGCRAYAAGAARRLDQRIKEEQ